MRLVPKDWNSKVEVLNLVLIQDTSLFYEVVHYIRTYTTSVNAVKHNLDTVGLPILLCTQFWAL